MSRLRPKEKAPRGPTGGRGRWIGAFVTLLRNTTWKCGRIERLAVNYLRRQFRAGGRTRIPVGEIVQHFRLRGKRKAEFIDAVKRLERRRIVKVEGL